MKTVKTFLVAIPARGGSKRLERKNVLLLNNKPLINYSIEAALDSTYITKVIVSSDDDEILDVSLKCGATILKRPRSLATDTSTTFDAVKHLIENAPSCDYIVLLQATSPLRTTQDINAAIELLLEKKADAVVSVCEMDHSPLWANTLSENASMEGFLSQDVLNKRSQDLDTFYRINGAIYICDTQKFLKEKTFFLRENTFAYKMNRESSIDIDEKIDFKIAEFILKENENEKG
ncbi:acylneuraminate cytidylyltransferase family protein [Sulfurimonas sp. SAG-AH-194-I05]|nr:acylneuraminate cytidylyltransferase family protein [Sulfurimonas sp. SAG-AH-194-I05]